MKLISLLDARLVRCGLRARTKEETFRELVELLRAVEPLASTEDVVEALRARDGLGSTTYGEVALPHARTDAVEDFHVLIGTSPEGIAYGDATVRLVVLFVVAKPASAIYLQAIAQFARLARDPSAVRELLEAPTPSALLARIEGHDLDVKSTISAADIMRAAVPSIGPAATVKEVVDRMARERHLELAVLEGGRFLGVLHVEDVLRLGIPESMRYLDRTEFLTSFEPFSELLRREESLRVETIYDRQPATVSPDTPLIRVALELVKKDVRALYVVDAEGVLRGTVESQDLVSKILRA